MAGVAEEGDAGDSAAGGYRVRPAKTDRGVAQEMAHFERNVKLLKMAGMLGPFMTEFIEEQERTKREREGEGGGGKDVDLRVSG